MPKNFFTHCSTGDLNDYPHFAEPFLFHRVWSSYFRNSSFYKKAVQKMKGFRWVRVRVRVVMFSPRNVSYFKVHRIVLVGKIGIFPSTNKMFCFIIGCFCTKRTETYPRRANICEEWARYKAIQKLKIQLKYKFRCFCLLSWTISHAFIKKSVIDNYKWYIWNNSHL